MASSVPRSYADAGRCGFALGLVLLASFVLAGRGLGASGAFAAAAGETFDALGVPITNPAVLDRIPVGLSLLNDWIVLEIAGVMIGGALSAWLAGRMRVRRLNVIPDKGAPATADPEASVVQRHWAPAFAGATRLRDDISLGKTLAGGALMGLGARLAYGCTSGLALSGGALMATGAWVFIPIAFGTAMALTLLAARRREET